MHGLAEGAVVGGKYRLQRELARGGMGSVWQAVHLQLDAPVAIKFMDTALGASDIARERFVREAKAAAQIQSPHVVHISDYGVEGGTVPYIVMELLQGEDLDRRLLRGNLSLAAAEQVVVQAAKGLRKAHEAGIVHRDLKPSNLFLAGDADDWTVKLVDFGVAKAIGADLPVQPEPMRAPAPSRPEVTQTGIVLGSPQYMSPEQARGFSRVDHTADVWALATIALRALTGRRLFEGMDAMQVLTRLVYEPLPAPSSLAPELPEPLKAVFDRALNNNPSLRYQSARELSDAFVRAANEVRRMSDTSSIAGATLPFPSRPSMQSYHSQSLGLPMPAPQSERWPKLAIAAAALSLGVMTVFAVVASGGREGGAAQSGATTGLVPEGPLRAMRAEVDGEAEANVEVVAPRHEEPPAEPDEGAGGHGAGSDDESSAATASPASPNPRGKGPRRSWGF